ncbi:helix-turn-helix domain-containing protein [Flavobacterium johnsoniae]|uniref:helix-turn-helix domain-containing protein n=1 Tax=Flavobacterium johnsoniae TaxID=986 RepID=UPI0005C5EC74|nr:helix-turn-helix transcriptional regulator [Flavobacterium johnsoniae]OXE95263.1 transcriptional regulator [Flavobacterium johnsoniae UW101]WQG82468.1 helix-turn-helix transcriptional regulator [Flavobacterium johnsoniae UW101]
MSEEFLIQLGNNINARAKAKFKTNLEFASACEIDEASIRRILKGKQNFSIKIFLKICTALDIKMSELLSEQNL